MASNLASQSPHGIPAAAWGPREQVALWQQAGGGAPPGPHVLNERSNEVYLARGLKPMVVLQMLQTIMSRETRYIDVQRGARVALLVNSLGSVTPNELHIAARAAIHLLQDTFKVCRLKLEVV